MSLSTVVSALMSANLASLQLAARKPKALRSYLSTCARSYRQAMGTGLAIKSPFELLEQQGWSSPSGVLELPLKLNDDSGTEWDEQMCLGAVTRLLRPKTVFEIGTYNGRTTAIFVLNAAPGATVITMDLPQGEVPDSLFQTDRELVERRRTGYILKDLGMDGRFRQVLCDSMEFDPAPYKDTVELGFIDGGHSLAHVRNDTEKMAVMAADRGIVLWHDYGGMGDFRDLTLYLEDLSKTIPLFNVSGTSLAWASMRDLAKLAR